MHAVDCWPQPRRGYPFLILDLVEGDDWHVWRWTKNPSATVLLDTFSDVVRTVGVLHERGVLHRDLKAENLLIRREDGHVFLIDFGQVRLPGTFAQTMGIPEGALHLLPPELLAYTRSEVWKQGVRFEGGVGADLYSLGVLFYQALTNRHPFDSKLADNALVAAIATVTPVDPQLINPLAPRSLSEIAMRLLEKDPAARYPHTEALLQALWQAGRERTSPTWKVPLLSPSETQPAEAAPSVKEPTPQGEGPVREEERRETPPEERRTWRVWHLLGVGLLLLLLVLASWMVRATLPLLAVAEPGPFMYPEKGNVPVPTLSPPGPSRAALVSLGLCSLMGMGCSTAQVRPQSRDCPQEAQHNMFEVLGLDGGMRMETLIDVKQPGPPTEKGVYQDGPIIGRVVSWERAPPQLPGGTLLYGYLWTGPGIQDDRGIESVEGRYTEALLPDGRRMAVCFTLGAPGGYSWQMPGSKPGAVRLPFQLSIFAVRRWP